MPSRLNSDGVKVRALRTQRGWTQEQLAEIAGVSARTIQRTETGGSAAFDTLRAIAGAFETDFDHLLRSEPCQIPEPVPPPPPPPAQAEDPIPESCHNATLSRPAQAVPRMRAIFAIASTALAAGLLAGALLVHRFYPPVELSFASPRPDPPVAQQSRAGEESRHDEAHAFEIPKVLPTVSSAVSTATIYGRESGHVAGESDRQQPVAAVGAFQVADFEPHTKIPEPMHSAFLELPLPRNPPAILSTYEMQGAWTSGLAYPGDLAQTDQAAGAVRQSIGLAAKKTGGALAKAGVSIWRVF